MNNSAEPENATETVTAGVGDDELMVSGSIPLSLFLVMSILATLGLCYSMALLFFNVIHRKKKIIKMTSPNVNIVILLGCCIAFVAIVLLGLSSPWIPQHIIPMTLQACVFLLPLSFTMVYGSLFAKVVRIHMIFTNLSFNGKSTRDEHLLLGVAALMLIDLAILLPWQFVDPITCHISTWKKSYDPSNNVTYASEECSSELQELWISLIYAYKVVMLSFGLYFTWQTRFVTLPSIRDARLIFVSVQSVALLGVTIFPILLVTSESAIIKYSVGSLAIWLGLVTTITFLFIPKARLLWLETWNKETAADSNSAARMQFSESMTKTKNAASKCGGRTCFFFCCCIQSADDNEDRYAQEILATEIETLKRTIKEKDLTIRELTDRLYVGTEKFQQYLTAKTKRYDGPVWPQPPVISQQHSNETCLVCRTTPNCDHLPNRDYLPSDMADRRCRSTVCSAPTVNDHHQRLQPIPPGQLDRRQELRNYRLSRYYTEGDEEDEDYDSRSYSDGSCSTCYAADLLEMQLRDAGMKRRMMPAADGPRELSAATLSFSYGEAQGYVHRGVHSAPRSAPLTSTSRYNRQYPSPSFQPRSVGPVDERTPSSAQDSAYDNSTESAVESVNPSHRPPTRTYRGQRTIEARNHDGHIDPQIVGVFSVHPPPTGEDPANATHLKMTEMNTTNPTPVTPTMTVGLPSSTNHRSQNLMISTTNGISYAPPSPTNRRNHGAVSANHQIRSLELNPSTPSILLTEPMTSLTHEPTTSNDRKESSLRLVSSDYPKSNGETVPQLATESQYAMTSLEGLSGIKTYGFMSVTQI